MLDDAQAAESRYTAPEDKTAALTRLAGVVPSLSADQAERVLERLREGGQTEHTDTVTAVLARLESVGGSRRAGRASKWFGDAGKTAERRAERQRVGTVAEQHDAYRAYIQHQAKTLEAATRGQSVTPAMRAAQARGAGMSLEQLLTSSPSTQRAHLSEEALRHYAGSPPMSFDAWRYETLGVRDTKAKKAHERRTAGYFSEHG